MGQGVTFFAKKKIEIELLAQKSNTKLSKDDNVSFKTGYFQKDLRVNPLNVTLCVTVLCPIIC